MAVGALDELLERQRTSVGDLDRKDMRRVVTPRPLSRELGYRHDLDRVDAELFQMPQTGRHRGELAGQVIILLIVERADMQFVDDDLVARREMKVVSLPVEGRVVDNSVADRAGYLAGIRVNALELAFRCGQQVAVLIADMSLGNIGIPMAVLFGVHGMPATVPVVERSDNGDSLCTRRPHAEPDSSRVRNGSHALDLRFTAHVRFLA